MPKLSPLFSSSLIMITLVIGVALAFRLGWIPGGEVYLEMTLEKPYLKSGEIKLPVRLQLSNPSGRVQRLPTQDVCLTFRWFILDARSTFVQSSLKDKTCLSGSIQRGLKPWEEIDETFTIGLDKKRFKSSTDYFLIVKFWGLQEEAFFTTP